MAFLSLKNISFAYKKTQVINDFSIEVEKGTFLTLLGSSGCGKTTILKLISGFLEPQKGQIIINDKVMNNVLPNKRKIGMVFQDYALFPHMNVEQNLMYGLKLLEEKKTKDENKELVIQTAKSLGIEELLNRYPAELSGGQQQRVALGRALVLKPDVLLMDEPLSSLDTRLRIKVREELHDLQRDLGITTIYVTHDQEEALSLSDKIAVLNEGNLIQFGTAQQIYFEPKNKFVADFVGRGNFLRDLVDGKEVEVMVRPEWLEVSKKSENSKLCGKIISKEFLGAITRLKIQIINSSINNGKIVISDISSFEAYNFAENEICDINIKKSKALGL